TFREDLYYRLNVISINIPPLRQRQEDIPPLAEMFIKRLNKKYNGNKQATSSFLLELMTMEWPGNIRELSNFVERQFILSESDTLSSINYVNFTKSHDSDENSLNSSIEDVNDFNMDKVVSSVEASLIKTVMKKSKNTNEASKLLGISQPTFSRKYNKYKSMGLI
ncbi:MAG: helix-turn-helix domain-containing protein, partial [Anaerovoracaceae bacterium]